MKVQLKGLILFILIGHVICVLKQADEWPYHLLAMLIHFPEEGDTSFGVFLFILNKNNSTVEDMEIDDEISKCC